jgi:preprotein translocase subunit SecD
MSSGRGRINPYLWAALLLAAGVALGCRSIEDRRRDRILYTTLWFHEDAPLVTPDTNRVMVAEIAGVKLPVNTRPFLTEEALEEATLVDSPGGGYSLRLKFNDHGRLVIDTFTASHRGRQVGIYVRYGVRNKQPKVPLKERWLAAPRINRQINDGVIVFTPHATRVELQEILEGLRNAAVEAQRPWVF